ncbi:restriction endonuclease subunit S [Bacillus sp. 1813sda1]|uniref:restriction endonuclease subunit S n=1 Tax=unclassified Bacillus (in: firmicutes) TaxID=185979 RepID=UPI00209DAFAC|nr:MULTISPECIES: restriction endonuclease subunit S [unclassified Bacillus (in: firmicutes)]MCP1166782.1 restriction endonuclease subunit S [Bacillus sp. 1813sda1]MDC7973143.1 restriction endonuclease subunit S [Bacillus sp. BLCC-B18]
MRFKSYASLYNWSTKVSPDYIVKSRYVITRLGEHVIEENRRIPYKVIEGKDINVMSLSSKEGILTPHIGIKKHKTGFLKEVRYNNLVFNPRRLNKGGIALFKGKDENQFVSGSYCIIQCKESLLPDYLYLVLRTKPLLESIGELMSRESVDYLNFLSFQEILIPLPPLGIQREIVDEYNETLLKIEHIEHQIYCIDNIMEEEIIDSLGIRNKNSRKPQDFNKVRLSSLHSWYVPQLLNDLNIRNIFNTKMFPRRPLIECVEINPLTERKASLHDKQVPYVSYNDLSKDYGEIETYQQKSNDFLKNDSEIYNGDILLAKKIDGLRDGKIAIVNFQQHLTGYVSSDFFVLRNKEGSKTFVSYIYYLLRSKIFRENYCNLLDITGINRRLNIDSLKNIELPVIPKGAQTVLVQKLDVLNNYKKELVREVAFLREYPREKELLRKLF